jgi:hypothetical protein
MDNYKPHNYNGRKKNWTRSGPFDGASHDIHLILLPRTFGLSAGAKRDEGINLLDQEAVRTFSLKCEGKWVPVNFSACWMNGSTCLNMLSNQKGVQCQINTLCFDCLYMDQNREVNEFLAILCFWSLAQNQTASHCMQNIMAMK